MQKFSGLIKNRRAKLFNFPSASSHHILHYLDVHLNDKSMDTMIINIEINDLLTNSIRSGMDDIVSNIKNFLYINIYIYYIYNIYMYLCIYNIYINIDLYINIHKYISIYINFKAI